MRFEFLLSPLLAAQSANGGMHVVDMGVLAVYLLLTLGLGMYCSQSQHSSKDYFLGGRSMHWLPVGMSLVVTLFSALSFTGIPAEAYRIGMFMILSTFVGWLETPVITRFVIPFYYNLGIYTAYEYLERRFDVSVRLAASLVFVLWRSLWLGAVLFAPCKVLLFTLGVNPGDQGARAMLYGLIIGLGVFTTVYTVLGGMKAVILTDALQFVIVVSGIGMIFGLCLWGPNGVGLTTAWQVAVQNGVNQMLNPEFSWTERTSMWTLLPHFALAGLSFYAADQITLQRYLTTPSLAAAQRSMWTGTVGRTIMLPMLVMLGVTLHVFYYSHPQRHEAMLDRIGTQTYRDNLAAGAVTPEQLLVDRQLQRSHMQSDLVMPYFITTELPIGCAGMIVAALFAAAMSSVDSGLNSVATSMIVDFHRRLGIGRRWLARWRGKRVEDLDEVDEMSIARPMCLLLGTWATVVALLVSQLEDIFNIMINVINTFGGPLLALVLLAIFSRRVGPRGALVALVSGMVFTASLTQRATIWSWLDTLFPSHEIRWDSMWELCFAVVFTVVVGQIASRLLDAPPTLEKLDGLVVGVGAAGQPRGNGN